MATLAPAPPVFTHWSQGIDPASIDHIPGEDGWPLIGTTLELLADPTGYSERMVARHGPVFRSNSFFRKLVLMVGAEANELVLLDRDRIFSSAQGWGPVLELVFPGGLMLMDFERHRVERKALSVAFKPAPMRHYAGALNAGMAERVRQWGATGNRDMRFYPAVKRLTLDLAATSFLGLPLGPEADRLNRAFIAMVQASIGIVRRPMPFTAMGRGVAGRRELVAWFTPRVLEQRAAGDAGKDAGEDIFSQFCRATTADGAPLTVESVVDHMIFLMMAAHDTITSSATHLVWLLAQHGEWQERLRSEALAATGGAGNPLAYDDLPAMELTEMAFKEALRLLPPVPSIMRRALRDFSFGGYAIPAGTPVGLSTSLVHRMAAHWPEPDRFDPLRFTPTAIAARHKYAWVPFGGGAHMCLGLHFAMMQTKILMAQLLSRYRIEADAGYAPKWQAWPIPKPRDGLKVSLVPLA